MGILSYGLWLLLFYLLDLSCQLKIYWVIKKLSNSLVIVIDNKKSNVHFDIVHCFSYLLGKIILIYQVK